MKDINLLVRENIKKLLPYSSARDDFQGQGLINLDANENPYFNSYNRYPDPYQRNLKLVISELKCVNIENIFIGHGSDEIIDLIIRAFCEPNRDAILTLAPSYGMYKVCADINNVECLYYTLNENYQIDFDVFDKLISPQVKVVFICSPNNPSGNSFDNDHIISLIKKHNAIFVIDEAYIDFSNKESLKNEITVMNNLIVMQTLSKAYGMAALRIGLAFCNHLIVATLNKIKPPYNLSTTAQHSAIHFLQSNNQIVEIIETIKIINFDKPVKASLKKGLYINMFTIKWKQEQAKIELVNSATFPIPQLPIINVPKKNRLSMIVASVRKLRCQAYHIKPISKNLIPCFKNLNSSCK